MVMLELMQELPGAKEGKEKVKVCISITSQNQILFQWYISLRRDDISPIKRWTALSICADPGLEGQDFKTLERQSSRPSGSTTLLWRISRFYPPLELWQKKFLHSGHLLLDLSTEKLEGANLKLHGAVSFFVSWMRGISSELDSQRFYCKSSFRRLIFFANQIFLPNLLCHLRQRVWTWRLWEELCVGWLKTS